MARTTKREREIEKLVSASFNRVGKNQQIPIHKLADIRAAGVLALANGADEAALDVAMAEAIRKAQG